MAIYKRGSIWWYKFKFQGISVRASTHTKNMELAARAERERRRSLEMGANALEPVRKPLLFSAAAKAWLENNSHWSISSREINTLKVSRLIPRFGGMLVSDIRSDHISAHQRERQKANASPRTINMEVSALRQILRANGRWSVIQQEVKMLREPEEVGRALSDDEMHRIYIAASRSRSRSLPVALCLFENLGVRMSELRTMKWSQVNLIARPGVLPGVITGKGKTKGGEGRFIPLNDDSLDALLRWRALFPDAKPEHCVFPSERYGLNGDKGMMQGDVATWNIDPLRPIGSWKTAWTSCRKAAQVQCRAHDLRHTFVSRLAAAGTPDATLMALTGHISRRMLERYSHTRTQAKLNAVQTLNRPRITPADVGTDMGTIH